MATILPQEIIGIYIGERLNFFFSSGIQTFEAVHAAGLAAPDEHSARLQSVSGLP